MPGSISPFGELLREWRGVRGMSQLELGCAAGVSSRHVSFVETGRSQPSRPMVLRLAENLDVPLRERNSLLLAAGFAPAYRESGLPDLAPVRRALELVLRSHEPYPAFVLDRGWDIVLANRSHEHLLATALPQAAASAEAANAARLVLDPELLRPNIANWEVVAHVVGLRIRQQLRAPGMGSDLRAHLEALLAFDGVREAVASIQAPPDAGIVVPLELMIDGHSLSWFSTIATIGTPQDVTLDELRIESLFPADDVTERSVRRLFEGVG
jgi:transcriptional regulator with XRE-family HTH domain